MGALWLYFRLFPGDETRIRALLADVAENASFQPDDGNFARAAAVSALMDCFSSDVEIQLDATPGEIGQIQGRRELQQVVHAAQSQVRSARITFAEVSVEFGAGPGSATAHMLATARIDGDEEPWVQELKMTLVKTDRAWKITRVETVPTLQMR